MHVYVDNTDARRRPVHPLPDEIRAAVERLAASRRRLPGTSGRRGRHAGAGPRGAPDGGARTRSRELLHVISIMLAMLVIVLLAALVVLYVAYPHRGEEVPNAPWLGDAMRKGVDAAPDARQPSADEQNVRRAARGRRRTAERARSSPSPGRVIGYAAWLTTST